MASPRILIQVLFCAVLWGAAFPLIKLAYTSWEHVNLTLCLFFAGVRFTISGAGILAVCKRPWHRIRQANRRLLVGLTLTQTCVQYLFFYLGMSISSGLLGALLVSCGSFWWILLAPLFWKTPSATARDWMAIALGSIGVSLAVYAPGAGSGKVLLGGLCFLLASLSGALGLIIMKPLSESIDAKTATGASLFFGGLLLLFTGIPAASAFSRSLSTEIVLVTLALAAISAIAFSIWNRLAHTYPVALLAGYRFLIPLCGTLQASLFIAGEAPGPGLILGGSLIIAAVYIVSRPKETDHFEE
ncbi:MAG: EamA family transporter [Verrucomicrobiaceae bacterium]|nr:EamA family transporter [Verrucomicrobiaceae bacterium]